MVVKIFDSKTDVILNQAICSVRSHEFDENVSVVFGDGFYFFHVPDFNCFLSIFWKSFCYWSQFSVGEEMRRRRYASVWVEESCIEVRVEFYYNEDVKGINYGRI